MSPSIFQINHMKLKEKHKRKAYVSCQKKVCAKIIGYRSIDTKNRMQEMSFQFFGKQKNLKIE